MKTFHDSGASGRRRKYNGMYLEKMLQVIDPSGKSVGIETPVNFREAVWHCFPLFEAGGKLAERANSILRGTKFEKCHFMPMNFTQILKKYGSVLEEDVAAKLRDYIMAHLDFMAADRIHISMYNDNFANMAIYTLLVAGEMFGLPEYFEKGKEKLLGVRDLFMRCGALMEYGSNTYTPIDTLCFAEMACHVVDEEARETALLCEERMWIEIASHYHPETARLAGPHSRAYAIDMVGHPHLFSGLAWFVFGDAVFANPVLDLFEPHQSQVMHGGLENLTLPNIAWIINTDYHCPEYLFDHAFNKKYPYETEYMTECIPANIISDVPGDMMHEYGGWRGRNYTFMTKEFAMGTAQSQFHGGALSESFHITYRNKPAERLYDTGVIYSRYIFNDKLPVRDNEYKIFGNVNYMGFRDEGRKICLQDRGAAIVAYKPKQYERAEVQSARLCIMIPVHFFDDLRLYTDSREIKELPYSSAKCETIYINVYKSFFAIIPLEATDLGRKDYIRIEKKAEHIMISIYNYEGEVREFGEKEMILTTNGFVCVAGDEFTGMPEFMEYARDHRLRDIMERQEGAWSRKIWFGNRETEMCLMFSPLTEGVFVNTVGRRPVGMNVIKADGIDQADIPFI